MAGGGRKNAWTRRIRPFSFAVIGVVFALNCIAAITSLTPKRYVVAEGAVAAETIYASRKVEDAATTNQLKESARNAVSDVKTVDAALVKQSMDQLNQFFTSVGDFRKTADSLKASSAPTATLADGTVVGVDDARTWKEVLPETEILSMTMALPVSIRDSEIGYALLDATPEQIDELKTVLSDNLAPALNSGVNESNIGKYGQELTNKVNITTIPLRLKSLASILVNECLVETETVDVEATNALRREAANSIDTVYIPRGKAIVQQGATISADQMTTLRALDMVAGEEKGVAFPVGTALYLLLAYGILFAYLKFGEPQVYGSNKQMTVLLMVLLLTVAIQWCTYLVNPMIMPAMLAVLLTCVLITPSMARAVNVTLALALPLLAGGSGETLLTTESFVAMAGILVSGQVAIQAASKSANRGELVGAGTLGGVCGGIAVAAGLLMRGADTNTILVDSGLTVATALVLSVFCVGMMSMWESVFDIATNARLHELTNTNHPLMKKLMTGAPGTYHHSMMAASLAEGAAEAIGANAVLARAGAMYHDVGKLRRPLFFTENQTDKNVHDNFLPEESAGYIISHVKDAEPLFAKYKMPGAIRQLAAEHHGNTLVSYFYYKAKKQQELDGEPVIERLFRYPGGTPSTKESGILMMADSCEAAVRSLGEPTKDQIAEMVHKVIQGKMEDGQFDQCPLTMAEMNKIEKSFLTTFSGLLHERIRYPEAEKKARTGRLTPVEDAPPSERGEVRQQTGRVPKQEEPVRSARVDKTRRMGDTGRVKWQENEEDD